MADWLTSILAQTEEAERHGWPVEISTERVRRLLSELDRVTAERDELSGWINALLSENSRYIRALSAIVAQTEYGPMLTDSVIQQARAALPKEAK